VELVQATGYELAGCQESAIVIVGFPCASPLNLLGASPEKNRPHHRAVNECRLDRDFSGFTRNKKTAFRRLSDDVSDCIPGASWNSGLVI
jgi:hypothetical protein